MFYQFTKKYLRNSVILRVLRYSPVFADILYQKKERRQFSVNRQFFEDYIGLDDQPAIKNLVGKREKILFAQTINRYDRGKKYLKSAKRDLIVNNKGIFLIGREPDKNARNKGTLVESVTRHITLDHLYQVFVKNKI